MLLSSAALCAAESVGTYTLGAGRFVLPAISGSADAAIHFSLYFYFCAWIAAFFSVFLVQTTKIATDYNQISNFYSRKIGRRCCRE